MKNKKTIYIFCVAVLLLGTGLFFYNVVKSFGGLGSTLNEFAFPGKHSLTLDGKGLYSIYYQYESVYEDETESSSVEDDSIAVYLTEAPTGEEIELKTPDSKKRYSYMGKKGVKIFEFEAAESGSYEIESFFREPSQEKSYTLVLEHGFEITRLKGILVSQAFLLVPILFSIILFLRTYIKG